MKIALVFISVRTKTVRGVMRFSCYKTSITGNTAGADRSGTPERRRTAADLTSELAQRERRLLADVGARVLEGGREAVDCARIAKLTEGEGHLLPHVGNAVLQRNH